MLKIPKGLKKKKKGKKSKRKGEEELFTEEELEQYRREHQPQPQTQPQEQENQQTHDPDSQEQPKPATSNDEWSKFNALTTGVDSILKKTQGDLDRIKSTSFFQRVPAGPKPVDRCGKELPLKRDAQKEGQGWIGFEEKKNQEETARGQIQVQAVQSQEAFEAPVEPLVSESESEEDEFDDIFDTSFVEAVEKGEVKLAYIPDSPEDVVEEGPDPFDTSYADKVIKGPEVSKKGIKLVNIGAAVEVLTGRIDHVTTSATATKKAKRRIPRDLLLETADSDDASDVIDEAPKSKSLLDDDAEIPDDVPVDLSVSLHTQFIKKEVKEDNPKEEQKDILSTFDNLALDDEDDEFAQLATESLNKPVEPISLHQAPIEPVLEDASWAAFEDSKSKPVRPPPPRPSSGPNLQGQSPGFNQNTSVDDDEGPDPFDTTFAENILPGKAELKQIEDTILNSQPSGIPQSDSDFDFNPREDEKPYINNRRKSSVHIHITDPTGTRESISGFDNGDVGELETLKPIHRDLLGGSSTDLTQLADSPIAPSAFDEKVDYSDPFDTSAVDLVVAPKKAELKFIEKELLGETQLKKSLSDPDFDPRAEEEAELKLKNATRKPSRPENLLVNKAVLFKIPSEGGSNLLDTEKDGKRGKPLTPYYNREASITDEEVDTQEDPFETSFTVTEEVSTKPASGSILKKRQDPSEIKRSSSNQDLNTEEDLFNEKSFSQLRRHSDFPIHFSKSKELADSIKKTDFLEITEEESVDTKVLTPYQESRDSVDFEHDPFDTSIVSNILLPGKTELKFLENELISNSNNLNDPDFDPRAEEKGQNQDLLTTSDDVFQIKALTPQTSDPTVGFLIGTEDDDVDPFDTSIADNLKPGKTELKILESKFMN